ncbi:hypothetical protein CVIRNUC_006729 [Coccomyxa viridis]|uniref:Uncharacterized protein n=1 Tax=Coccomyxa viridis TaxID=1274662 RepID=A0AAV1IBX4_9CHLO|nr:hypothetical protein CVIRNUC_006729 [Coccomyxa viridis]
MDDFEFIEKEELIDEKPEEGIIEASESCHEAEAVSGDGMPTEQQHETASVKSFEGDEPPKNIVPLEEDSLQAMEQELDDDLSVLNLHHLVLLGRIARQLALRAKSGGLRCWSMARAALHDGACEDAVRAHGVSVAAAAVTLILSLLLVSRQEEAAMGSTSVPSSMVSIARPGVLCSPLPAAVLALAHNFTAAQSMQEPLPASLSVLDAHARDAKEHFELARSLFKQGASEKHVHGHRARSQQRKAAKELRKTSKWAVRELHSLEGLRQRFTQDAQEALRLERDGMEMVVEQLPGLVNALSETDVYVVRRVLRNLSHMHGRSEAAVEAMRSSYKAAVKGVAYLASAFDSHWERMRPALRSAIEGELASRKTSLESLSLALCLPSLEQHIEGDTSTPAQETGSCPLSAMDAVVYRVQATLAFQERLIRLLPTKASMPPLQGQHKAAVAACERSGGLAIALQRRHADLATLAKRQHSAAAA